MVQESLSRKVLIAAVAALLLMAGRSLVAQEKSSQSETQEQNIDTYADLLQQDVQKQKVAITSQLMQLAPDQAARFWPVYKDYAKELTALGSLRIQGIKDYATNYGSLSDQKAAQLADIRFQYEAKLLALKRKYFERFSKALTPKLAARFFQVENQLLDIIDLQVASSLPIVQ